MSDKQFEDPGNLIKPQSGLLAGLRNSFLTGLVVIAPVALTIWLIWSVIGWIDGFVLPFIPSPYHPDNILNTIFGQDVAINIRAVSYTHLRAHET